MYREIVIAQSRAIRELRSVRRLEARSEVFRGLAANFVRGWRVLPRFETCHEQQCYSCGPRRASDTGFRFAVTATREYVFLVWAKNVSPAAAILPTVFPLCREREHLEAYYRGAGPLDLLELRFLRVQDSLMSFGERFRAKTLIRERREGESRECWRLRQRGSASSWIVYDDLAELTRFTQKTRDSAIWASAEARESSWRKRRARRRY